MGKNDRQDGLLLEDAVMRFTPGGKAVAIARVQGAVHGGLRIELWEGLAEAFIYGPNGAAPLKGDFVQFEGYEKRKSWFARDGRKMSYQVFTAKRFRVVTVDSIGACRGGVMWDG